MRHTGTLKSWNDERGFGFITPDGARQDVFVHISAFPAINGRPLGGERLGFDLELDREGRQRAVHVRVLPPLGLFQSGGRVDDLPAAWTAPRLLIIPVFGGIYGAVSSQWGFYPYVLTGYVAVSLVTFLVYDLDKGAAMERRWRTREKTLHWLSMSDGWRNFCGHCSRRSDGSSGRAFGCQFQPFWLRFSSRAMAASISRWISGSGRSG